MSSLWAETNNDFRNGVQRAIRCLNAGTCRALERPWTGPGDPPDSATGQRPVFSLSQRKLFIGIVETGGSRHASFRNRRCYLPLSRQGLVAAIRSTYFGFKNISVLPWAGNTGGDGLAKQVCVLANAYDPYISPQARSRPAAAGPFSRIPQVIATSIASTLSNLTTTYLASQTTPTPASKHLARVTPRTYGPSLWRSPQSPSWPFP